MISRRKDAHKAMCVNSVEENKYGYERIMNKAMKAV